MKNTITRMFGTLMPGIGLALFCVSPVVCAEAGAGEFKVTLGQYELGGGGHGTDLNLRWRRDGRTLWLLMGGCGLLTRT